MVSSRAPEHTHIEPGSIACEDIKRRCADDAAPVFTTMALLHGMEAQGAVALREGFSWNARMDLLWALGYPHVVFIVDGFPADDTKQGILDYWNPERREFRWWRDRAVSGNPRVISRRGAFAQVYELANRKNPFQLSDDDFLRVTEPREIDKAEVISTLRNIKTDLLIARAALVLEALVGPSWVAEAFCVMAEDGSIEDRGDYRGKAASALAPVLRRVPAGEAAGIRERLGQIPLVDGQDPDWSFIEATLDPLKSARRSQEQGQASYALGPLQWADGEHALLAACYDAQAEIADVPRPRLAFVGGAPLIEREVANFDRYSDGTQAYLHDYSTICHTALLKPALRLLGEQDTRDCVSYWLKAHAEAVRPRLEELTKAEGYERLARSALQAVS